MDIVHRRLHLPQRQPPLLRTSKAVFPLPPHPHRPKRRIPRAAKQQHHGRPRLAPVSPSDDELHGLERLQHAHDADDRPQDAALAAPDDARRRGRPREHAAVAGPAAGRVVERDELPGGLEGGRGHEGLAQQHARVGHEVARGRVVGAVEDEVVLRDDVPGVLGREGRVVRVVGDAWVEAGE